MEGRGGEGKDELTATHCPTHITPVLTSYSFTSRDVDNMSFVLRFSSNVLANTLAYERERVLKKQNEALLQVARKLFTSLGELLSDMYCIVNREIFGINTFLLVPYNNKNKNANSSMHQTSTTNANKTMRKFNGQILLQAGVF